MASVAWLGGPRIYKGAPHGCWACLDPSPFRNNNSSSRLYEQDNQQKQTSHMGTPCFQELVAHQGPLRYQVTLRLLDHLHPWAERQALEKAFEGLQACNRIF